MTRKCLGAWTEATGNYPAYISINQDDGGVVEITVRAERLSNGQCGPTVTALVSKERFAVLLLSALRGFT